MPYRSTRVPVANAYGELKLPPKVKDVIALVLSRKPLVKDTVP